MERTEIKLDKDKISSTRKALKRDFSIYIGSLIGILLLIPLGYIVKNNFAGNITAMLMIIFAFIILIFQFIIIFRIRYVYRAMGKSLTTITLFQLGAVFIPFGIFIFPAIVLDRSKEVIASL